MYLRRLVILHCVRPIEYSPEHCRSCCEAHAPGKRSACTAQLRRRDRGYGWSAVSSTRSEVKVGAKVSRVGAFVFGQCDMLLQ